MTEHPTGGNLEFPGDIATPVGEPCGDCDEPIAAGDRGQMVPHRDAAGVIVRPIHVECLLRDVVGGIEHLTAGPHATGTCYEGTTLTRRQSAVAAFRWIQEHGVPG